MNRGGFGPLFLPKQTKGLNMTTTKTTADLGKTPQATDKPDGLETDSKSTHADKAVQAGKDAFAANKDAGKAQPSHKPSHSDAQRDAMAALPPDHTYQDRVRAQAEALGIDTKGKTMETLMREIREKASS